MTHPRTARHRPQRQPIETGFGEQLTRRREQLFASCTALLHVDSVYRCVDTVNVKERGTFLLAVGSCLV
jgi:hypothetical protein